MVSPPRIVSPMPRLRLVAVTVKLFAVRDCCAVGVHERVLPLSVAPAGAFDKENVTAVPLAAS